MKERVDLSFHLQTPLAIASGHKLANFAHNYLANWYNFVTVQKRCFPFQFMFIEYW